MTIFKTGKFLAAAAAGAMMFAGVSAQASQLHFTPNPAGGATVSATIAGEGGLSSSLNTGVDLTKMTWQAVNDSGAANTWAITTDGSGNLSEMFTFNLLQTDNNGADNAIFGKAGNNTLNNFNLSHVTMEVIVNSGTATSIGDGGSDATGVSGAAGVDPFAAIYTDVTFNMYFHPDGNTETDPQGNLIAIFSGSGDATNGANNKSTLEWDATLVAALAGVFEYDGSDVTDGAGDFGDGLSTATENFILKTTTQVIQVGDVNQDDSGLNNRNLLVGLDSGGTSVFAANVPEPGALALFGIGLVGLGMAARRRQKVAA
jgi:hypothetical protein